MPGKNIMKNISYKQTNTIIFLLGLLITICGYLWNPIKEVNGKSIVNTDLKNLLMSIGCSVIASSIISFLTQKYLERKDIISEMIEDWRINSIYKTREEANTYSIDKKMNKLNKQLDIIAFGLDHFRNSKDKSLKERIRKNKDLDIRILTLNPKSEFVIQRERDENKSEGSIKKSINDLINWVDKINKNGKRTAIQIKYYDNLPFDSYLRIDDIIYTGPYEYAKMSSQSITYEFEQGGNGFSYYSNYFEELWNNNELCKSNLDSFREKLPECCYPNNNKTCNKFYEDGVANYFTSYTDINNAEVNEYIKKAKSVKFIEVYSEKNIKQYFNALKEMLSKNNGELEIVILDSSDSNSNGFKYLNDKFITGNNMNGKKVPPTGNCIDNSGLLSELTRLKELTGKEKKGINIYYTDYLPQYSAMIIDNIAYVTLYQTSPGRSTYIPAFKIAKDKDSKFYDFISNDFNNLIENSKIKKEEK